MSPRRRIELGVTPRGNLMDPVLGRIGTSKERIRSLPEQAEAVRASTAASAMSRGTATASQREFAMTMSALGRTGAGTGVGSAGGTSAGFPFAMSVPPGASAADVEALNALEEYARPEPVSWIELPRREGPALRRPVQPSPPARSQRRAGGSGGGSPRRGGRAASAGGAQAGHAARTRQLRKAYGRPPRVATASAGERSPRSPGKGPAVRRGGGPGASDSAASLGLRRAPTAPARNQQHAFHTSAPAGPEFTPRGYHDRSGIGPLNGSPSGMSLGMGVGRSAANLHMKEDDVRGAEGVAGDTLADPDDVLPERVQTAPVGGSHTGTQAAAGGGGPRVHMPSQFTDDQVPRKYVQDKYLPLTELVGRSEHRLHVVRNATPRFKKASHMILRDPALENTYNTAEYNTDRGRKAGVNTQVATSPRKVATMQSSVPRFRKPFHHSTEGHTDTELDEVRKTQTIGMADAGAKATLVTHAARLGNHVVSAMNSETPRFPTVPKGRDPQLYHQLGTLDYGDVQRVEPMVSALHAGAVKYANVRSVVPRWQKPVSTTYSTNLGPGSFRARPSIFSRKVMKGGQFQHQQRFPPKSKTQIISQGPVYNAGKESERWFDKGFAADKSPRKFAIHNKDAVDYFYKQDSLHKTTLATGVKESPRRYAATLNSNMPRVAGTGSFVQGITNFPFAHLPTSSKLGPGSYKPPITKDGQPIAITVKEPARPSPSFRNPEGRFPDTPASPTHVYYVDPSTKKQLGKVTFTYEGSLNHGSIAENIRTTAQTYSSLRSAVRGRMDD